MKLNVATRLATKTGPPPKLQVIRLGFVLHPLMGLYTYLNTNIFLGALHWRASAVYLFRLQVLQHHVLLHIPTYITTHRPLSSSFFVAYIENPIRSSLKGTT